jgi:Txe/YoeB family toxin of toxin-antitoxin system
LVSSWTLAYSRQAQKDAKRLASSGLQQRAQTLLDVLIEDPFRTPPRYEKLVGDLAGCYSRRINIQHRLVYEVFPDRRIVHVLRMWTHYE